MSILRSSWALALSCALIGCGFLTPWYSLISAVDYFQAVYPERDAMRYINVITNVVMLLTVILNSLFPAADRGYGRVTCGLCINCATLLFLPIMDVFLVTGDKGSLMTFLLVMLCAGLIGFGDGMAEGPFLGLALYLPPRYYQAYQGGVGFGYLIIVSMRILTKAILSVSPNGLRTSACIFFAISCGFEVVSLLAFHFVIIPHPLLKRSSTGEENVPLTEEQPDNTSKPSIWKRLLDVTKLMKIELIGAFLIAFVKFIIYPGVLSDVECDALGDWYGVMLVGFMALSDFTTKLTPARYICKKPTPVKTGTLCLLLLPPLIFFLVQLTSSPFVVGPSIIVLGLSAGYLAMCVLALGQKVLEGSSESFLGGNLLVLVYMIGMSSGAIGSLGWAELGKQL